MTWLKQFSQPIIFAHRGACAYAPENTLASFSLALKQGAPAIELDAKLSLDGQVVVIHDQTVDRTTNGHGEVRKLTLAAMRELDAGSFKDAQYAGEHIPTLEEVFETVGKQLYVNVELTNYASTSDGLPDRVAEIVRRCGMQERVLFSSFYPFNLTRIRRLIPEAPVGLLALEKGSGSLARGWFGRLISPDLIHPYLEDVTEVFMRKQKRLGRRVHVWTVNQPEDMRRMFSLGVSGFFTDDPALALSLLK